MPPRRKKRSTVAAAAKKSSIVSGLAVNAPTHGNEDSHNPKKRPRSQPEISVPSPGIIEETTNSPFLKLPRAVRMLIYKFAYDRAWKRAYIVSRLLYPGTLYDKTPSSHFGSSGGYFDLSSWGQAIIPTKAKLQKAYNEACEFSKCSCGRDTEKPIHSKCTSCTGRSLGLLRVSRLTYQESISILYAETEFEINPLNDSLADFIFVTMIQDSGKLVKAIRLDMHDSAFSERTTIPMAQGLTMAFPNLRSLTIDFLEGEFQPDPDQYHDIESFARGWDEVMSMVAPRLVETVRGLRNLKVSILGVWVEETACFLEHAVSTGKLGVHDYEAAAWRAHALLSNPPSPCPYDMDEF